jgi:hypothetical protein
MLRATATVYEIKRVSKFCCKSCSKQIEIIIIQDHKTAEGTLHRTVLKVATQKSFVIIAEPIGVPSYHRVNILALHSIPFDFHMIHSSKVGNFRIRQRIAL